MKMKSKNVKVQRIRCILFLGVCMMVLLSGCQKKQSQPKDTQVAKEWSGKEPEHKELEPEVVANPEFQAEQICQFKVELDGNTKYQLDYMPRKDRQSFLFWDMTVPYESIGIVDTEAMFKLYNTIAGIEWKSLVKADAKEESQYGIESTKNKISISYTNKENTEDVERKADKKAILLVGNKNKENQYYCAFESAKSNVFLVPSYLLDAALGKEPFDMVLKIPFLLDIRTVKNIEICYGEQKLTMSQNNGQYKRNGKTIEEKEYKDSFARLLSLEANGECLSIPAKVTPLITLKYQRTSQELEDYQIRILPYDDANDAVEVNGKAFFTVDKVQAEEWMQNIESWRK